MKTNELRIGNFVKLGKKKNTLEVYGVKSFDVGIEGISNELNVYLMDKKYIYNVVSDEDIKPIKITEEWLLKFGFKKTDNKYMDNYIIPISTGYWHSVNYDNEDCEWYYNNDYSDASCYYVASIKYVHQLQNLYFALTRKELTFKSE
jgi:hypothetical protein